MKYTLFCLVIGLFFALGVIACQSSPSHQRSVSAVVERAAVDSLIYDNDTLAFYKIDSVSFFEQKAAYPASNDTIAYVSDFEQARELLKGRITFGGWNDAEKRVDSLLDDQQVAAIRFNSGDSIPMNKVMSFWDTWFVSYFPSEDLVLFEGGHSSDFSVDLRRGLVGADTAGNPSYIRFSPTKKYRLNGWFPGQECSDYFIEKLVNGNYQYHSPIPTHIGSDDFLLCNITDIFWVSDTEMYFRNTFFMDDDRLGFFRLQIK